MCGCVCVCGVCVYVCVCVWCVCVCVCVCVYTYCSQYRDGGWAEEIKMFGTEMTAVCQGNRFACHFGRACYSFGSLDL